MKVAQHAFFFSRFDGVAFSNCDMLDLIFLSGIGRSILKQTIKSPFQMPALSLVKVRYFNAFSQNFDRSLGLPLAYLYFS